MQTKSIILAFSNITEAYLPKMNEELQAIRGTALKSAISGKYVRTIEHSAGTYNSLSDLLNSDDGKDVSIFHYSGHSSAQGLKVAWQGDSGEISSEFLSLLFKAHKKFVLVFLNSCYSEEIAKELIAAGVPYVIGTTDRIKDSKAAIVAGQFYTYLARPGKTIKEAFELTRSYFSVDSYTSDPDIREAFRSFKLEKTKTNKYPWEIYTQDNVAAEYALWTLVPDGIRNLILSGDSAKNYKLKIFCVYDPGDCKDLYKTIVSGFINEKNKLSNNKNELLFNCFDEISPGDIPAEKDIIKECHAADIILHLLSARYDDFWKKNAHSLADTCKQKQNISLTWDENSKNVENFLESLGINISAKFPESPFQAMPIKKWDELMRTDSLFNTCICIQVFSGLEQRFKAMIDSKYIDLQTLENRLYQFNFFSELLGREISKAHISEKLLFFILIEGTPLSAQNLLYKKLRSDANIKSNIIRKTIPLSSIEGKVPSKEEFYMALAKELMEEQSFDEFFSDAGPSISRLKSKLAKTDIVLFFDDLGAGKSEDIKNRKALITTFWKDLQQYLPADPANRLFIFAINRSYPDYTFTDLDLFVKEPFKVDKITIEKLSGEEFNQWYNNSKKDFLSPKFTEMYNSKFGEIVGSLRYDSMHTICLPLIGNEKDSVINKVLDYDSYTKTV